MMHEWHHVGEVNGISEFRRRQVPSRADLSARPTAWPSARPSRRAPPRRCTAAASEGAGRCRTIEVSRIAVHLAADRGPARAARVVVLVTGGQDEEELLANRRGRLAAGAEEARRLELSEAVRHELSVAEPAALLNR
jgi:hypothetical protein